MVTSMLEKAIEIEGLLRIIRDGDPLPETYKLLNAKTARLAMEATSLAAEAESYLKKEEEPKKETPKVDFVMAAPAQEAETPKVDFTAPDSTSNEQPLIIKKEAVTVLTATAPDLPEADLDLEEEDDILLSFDDVPEQTSTTEGEETVSTKVLEEYPESWDSTEEENEPEDRENAAEGVETEETVSEPESQTMEEPTASQTPELPEAAQKKESPKRQTKLKSAFSLNDRFLYARELFNGNMKIFDSTLEFIEGIDDYSLVEDYFYSELEWDPENANVASFMEILRPQFRE